VHTADIQDRDGARLVLEPLRDSWLGIRRIWADGGYAGELVRWVSGLRTHLGVELEIVRRSDTAKGFEVLPKRWIVERTLGWLGRCRRLAKDFEFLILHSEAMLDLAMISLMLRRLLPE
jgi:putative transposase